MKPARYFLSPFKLKLLVDLRYSGSVFNRWRVRHTKKAASHCLVLILSKPEPDKWRGLDNL